MKTVKRPRTGSMTPRVPPNFANTRRTGTPGRKAMARAFQNQKRAFQNQKRYGTAKVAKINYSSHTYGNPIIGVRGVRGVSGVSGVRGVSRVSNPINGVSNPIYGESGVSKSTDGQSIRTNSNPIYNKINPIDSIYEQRKSILQDSTTASGDAKKPKNEENTKLTKKELKQYEATFDTIENKKFNIGDGKFGETLDFIKESVNNDNSYNNYINIIKCSRLTDEEINKNGLLPFLEYLKKNSKNINFNFPRNENPVGFIKVGNTAVVMFDSNQNNEIRKQKNKLILQNPKVVLQDTIDRIELKSKFSKKFKKELGDMESKIKTSNNLKTVEDNFEDFFRGQMQSLFKKSNIETHLRELYNTRGVSGSYHDLVIAEGISSLLKDPNNSQKFIDSFYTEQDNYDSLDYTFSDSISKIVREIRPQIELILRARKKSLFDFKIRKVEQLREDIKNSTDIQKRYVLKGQLNTLITKLAEEMDEAQFKAMPRLEKNLKEKNMKETMKEKKKQ